MDVADARAGPAQRIVETIEAQLDEVVATAVDTIWEQVPAYPASSAPELRRDLTTHVGLVFRALVTSLKEDRPARADDFPVTELQAALRLRQGISLSDFLHAFRIGELTFWEAVLDVAQDDPGTREAALALAGPVMRGIEAGSTVAAEAYLYAQQHELAESDRVRRDLLEDLLARREIPPGPKQAMLRETGLAEPEVRLVVISAASPLPLADERALRDAAGTVRGLAPEGLTVVRQNEITGIAPVPVAGPAAAVDSLRRALPDPASRGLRLCLGISTAHTGLAEVPEAYTEACSARDGLGGIPGMVALPLLSSLDYLVLHHDETALRLIRPDIRRFVEEDRARGGDLIATFLAYTASDLNAKVAAQRLHLHTNTAYYRLERIAERTGCDLRRFSDVVELLVAVRLLDMYAVRRGSAGLPAWLPGVGRADR